MPGNSLVLTHCSFSYDSSVDPLFEDIDLVLDRGWTGVVGPNGAGKTTLLMLAAGRLESEVGSIIRPDLIRFCEQRTDAPDNLVNEFFHQPDHDAYRLMDILGIEADWIERWDSLSHGERKRSQIASCLWQEPELLAVDEPTNHLDRAAREFVLSGLRQYNGIGLIVSHDREILDTLCSHVVFVNPPQVEKRSGAYTQAVEARTAEQEHVREEYYRTRQNLKRLEREAAKRRALAASQQARRSKKGLDLKDHDARFKRNLARITGKDGTGGKLLRQMDGTLEQEQSKLSDLEVEKHHVTGISIDGTESKRDALYRGDARRVTFGESATGLEVPELVIGTADRIGVSGDNGTGKSTLIESIVGEIDIPADRYIHIPQEISVESSRDIERRIGALSNERLGELMAIVSRLGSRPERLIGTTFASPGETRKFTLALGMLSEPWLIVMDEPTNHMDLPSIEAMEAALSDSGSALLLVSHDERFLDSLTNIRWHTASVSGGSCILTVER